METMTLDAGRVCRAEPVVRDTYGVEIAPGENRALVLAVTVAVDTMAHPGD